MQHDGLKKVVDGARVRESASDVKSMAGEARVEQPIIVAKATTIITNE